MSDTEMGFDEAQARYMERADRREFVAQISAELDHAYKKHGNAPWSRHEFYAILLEEVEEMWSDIKTDQPTDVVLGELVQVAAMCLRYWETGDSQRGAHCFPIRRGL